MKLRFLGTRGEIGLRTARRRRQSALLVSHGGRELMIDCGVDWLERLPAPAPRAIVLTHAHADHAAASGTAPRVPSTPPARRSLSSPAGR